MLLIAGAILLSSCGDDPGQTGRWTVPADAASLCELWSQATMKSGNPDLSDAQLTSFTGLWSGDGTIYQVRLQARTDAGSELSIWAETPAGSDTTVVWSGLIHYPESRNSQPAINPVPSASEVLASIDAVTIEGLASAASADVSGGEFLTLWLSRLAAPQDNVTLGEAFPGGASGGRYLSTKDGGIASLGDTTLLSSLAPAEHLYFAKARRNRDGGIQGGVSDSIVHVFVR